MINLIKRLISKKDTKKVDMTNKGKTTGWDKVIIITGTRDGWDWGKLRTAIKDALGDTLPEYALMIHGAAKGVDTQAGFIGQSLGMSVSAVPAQWDKYGKRAGYIRNEEMMEMAMGEHSLHKVVLAFPGPKSKGTIQMMDMCEENGLKVVDHSE